MGWRRLAPATAGLLCLLTLTPTPSSAQQFGVGLPISAAKAQAREVEVFVVPHSHCDTGYKKTIEGYYLTEVRHVLNSVTDYLATRPELRFTWAESAYLWRWWKDEPARFSVFKRLVEKGQIELVNGGWTMHDEAITSYDAQIAQTRMGHELLRSLGFKEAQLPRVGWQPDPFGPSSWTPTLMALSGYDAWVTNRIPDPIKAQLKANRSLEFVWQGSASLPAAHSAILTHVLDTHYESPAGFDWEPPVPGSSATPVTATNVGQRADAWVSTMLQRADWYATPLLLVPLGGDFEYQNASINYGNMSLLMDYVASHGDHYLSTFNVVMKLRYATPSDYFRRLKQLNPALPVLRSSPFLPLVSGEGGMAAGTWSGYYSGYPALKELSRKADSALRQAEVLQSLAGGPLSDAATQALAHARRHVHLMPHHDNLPATGYNFNNADLEVNLRRALQGLDLVMAEALAALALPPDAAHPTTPLTLDGTQLRTIDDGQAPLPVLVWNGAGKERSDVVRLKVSRPDLLVTDAQGLPVPSQVLSDWEEDGVYWLHFEATVGALGWATFALQVCRLTHWTLDYPPVPGCAVQPVTWQGEDLVKQGGIANDVYSLHFTGPGGDGACTLDGLAVKRLGQSLNLRQTFQVYNSPGDSVYMFKPTSPAVPKPLSGCSMVAQVGPLVSELHVASASAGIAFTFALTNASTNAAANGLIRLDHRVGGLAPFDNLVTRFDGFPTPAAYSYHENGYERRPADYNTSLSVGNNYRPFVSRAALRTPSGKLDLHVVGHAPHGTTSPQPGSLEFMLHRRAAYQPLRGNDRATVDLSPMWLLVDEAKSAETLATHWATALQTPWIVATATDPALHIKAGWSGLHSPLPGVINLFTLTEPAFASPDGAELVTLQLEHLVDTATGGQAVEAKVDLAEMFKLRRRGNRSGTVKCEERTVTGAYPIQRLSERMTWKTSEELPLTEEHGCNVRQDSWTLSMTIRPKDICTVVCKF